MQNIFICINTHTHTHTHAHTNISKCLTRKIILTLYFDAPLFTTFFSFVKSTQIIYLVEITYYFECLMIKSISFVVLTHFFHFNQLKMLRQPGYLIF